MIKLGLILLGGGIGAVLRYLLSTLMYQFAGPAFPVGTLAVNLLGSFAIGFLSGVAERAIMPPDLRNFLQIGILGGFTTFSSFGLETIQLLRDGEMGLATANVLLNNVGGLALVLLGFVAAQALMNHAN
jgi:fluoride exporter